MQRSRGFTLIELLVVIAIIGLLAAVVLASLNTARAKARDARRVSDVREIQKALELYYHDHGSYPTTGNAWYAGSTVCQATWGKDRNYTGATGYIPNLAPTYIPVLPEDPSLAASRCYIYRSDGNNYKLLVHYSVETLNIANHPFKDPARPTAACLAMYSPGAATW